MIESRPYEQHTTKISLDILDNIEAAKRAEKLRKVALIEKAFEAAARGTAGHYGDGSLPVESNRFFAATDLLSVDDERALYLDERLPREGESINVDNVLELKRIEGEKVKTLATFYRHGSVQLQESGEIPGELLGTLETLIEAIDRANPSDLS